MLAISIPQTNNNIKKSSYSQMPLQTSFKGYSRYDVVELGKKLYPVIYETSTFREPQTLKFIEKHIKTKFPPDKEKNIIVGACSSGEEAMSLAMLLQGTNTKIKGFDISPQIIERANKHEYLFKRPANETTKRVHAQASCYDDTYLVFNNEPLNQEQKQFKELFDKHFEEIDTKNEKFSFRKFFKSFFFDLGMECDQFDKKKYKLKDDSNLNCDFVIGDILELDKITPPKSADIVTFKNAFFQLVTSNIGQTNTPHSTEVTQKVFEKVCTNVNKALKKNGLFIFGENESKQNTDVKLLTKILKKHGFKPAENDGMAIENIWIKYKDI